MLSISAHGWRPWASLSDSAASSSIGRTLMRSEGGVGAARGRRTPSQHVDCVLRAIPGLGGRLRYREGLRLRMVGVEELRREVARAIGRFGKPGGDPRAQKYLG